MIKNDTFLELWLYSKIIILYRDQHKIAQFNGSTYKTHKNKHSYRGMGLLGHFLYNRL